MPILRDACTELHIGRTTLEKWCKRLAITPTRHPRDYRFWVISDEELEAIREARAEMPAPFASGAHTTSTTHRPLATERIQTSTPQAHRSDLALSAMYKSNPGADDLPEGWVSWRSFAQAHGVPASTVQKAIDVGRLTVTRGRWKVGQSWCLGALDPEQQQQFVQLWSRSDGHE